MESHDTHAASLVDRLAVAHGAFFTTFGLWPLLHRRSFEAVTGKKVDWWLVEAVGGLLVVEGAALLRAGRRGAVSTELSLVAAGSASVLATICVVHVARRRISPLYLLDAEAELGFVAAWAVALARRSASVQRPQSPETGASHEGQRPPGDSETAPAS